MQLIRKDLTAIKDLEYNSRLDDKIFMLHNLKWLMNVKKLECGHIDIRLTLMKEEQPEAIGVLLSVLIGYRQIKFDNVLFTDDNLSQVIAQVCTNDINYFKVQERFMIFFGVADAVGIKPILVDFWRMEDTSDLAIVAQGVSFYVDLKVLLENSNYIKDLYEKGCAIAELFTDLDPVALQNYFELIYGPGYLTDDTVNSVLEIAYEFSTPVVLRECERYLIAESNFHDARKLKIAKKYNLESLTYAAQDYPKKDTENEDEVICID